MTKRHSPGTGSMISKGNNLEHRIFPWRWQIKAEKKKKMEIHSDGNFFLYSFSISASVTSISIAICIEAFEATVKVLYCVFPFYIFLLFIFTVFLAFFSLYCILSRSFPFFLKIFNNCAMCAITTTVTKQN